jgi:V/A-type H+-transporting ATPase subunit E
MAETIKSASSSLGAKVALGVESLIERLRNEGVAKGRTEADRIIREAQGEAEATKSKAQEEADQIVSRARAEVTNLEQAGHQALQVAARDTALDLRNRLEQRFAGEVRHLVREEVQRQELLEKLILEVAGRAREEAASSDKLEVLLPDKAAGLDDLTKDATKIRDTPLGHFAVLITRSVLRQGVTLATSRDLKSGIKVRLTDKGIDLDLSDKAIADLLLQHLQPRFRALLEGIL